MTHGQKPESAFYTNTIKMTLQPDPFKIGMPGGTISFFKGGRVTSDFPDPDEAAKIFLHYVEQHYQRHIIEAEARGAAEQSRKDAEGQEPVGYLSATGLEQIASQLHGYANLRRSRGSAEFARKWGPDIPLYDRPANVAALEARVKELEAIIPVLTDLVRACEEEFTGPNTGCDADEDAVGASAEKDMVLTFGHIRRGRRILDTLMQGCATAAIREGGEG